MKEDPVASTSPATQTSAAQTGSGITPKVWQIALTALIAIAFTAGWLGLFDLMNEVIWENEYVAQNRWTLPVGVMFFSLLVGLAQKYLAAPTVIHGGAMEAVTGSELPSDRSTFLGTLLASYGSLLSGASIGPEGALGFLILQISTWLHNRLRASKESGPGFAMAAMASAYNGVVGSALFTGVLATEMRIGGSGQQGLVFLIWNLLAGAIGFLFYAVLGLSSFATAVAFTPIGELTRGYMLTAILLGILGALMAVLIRALFNVFEQVMERAFKDKVIWRILAAGVVISIVGYFVPEVLFAGETQIFPMINNPAQYGVSMLIMLGLLKLVMLALSFKSGYMGGPTFPILFAATMFGLALSLLFPTIPVSIFVLCLESAVMTLVLRAPLTAILLVTVVGTATPNEIALLVLSAVTAMMLGILMTRTRARRAEAAHS